MSMQLRYLAVRSLGDCQKD